MPERRVEQGDDPEQRRVRCDPMQGLAVVARAVSAPTSALMLEPATTSIGTSCSSSTWIAPMRASLGRPRCRGPARRSLISSGERAEGSEMDDEAWRPPCPGRTPVDGAPLVTGRPRSENTFARARTHGRGNRTGWSGRSTPFGQWTKEPDSAPDPLAARTRGVARRLATTTRGLLNPGSVRRQPTEPSARIGSTSNGWPQNSGERRLFGAQSHYVGQILDTSSAGCDDPQDPRTDAFFTDELYLPQASASSTPAAGKETPRVETDTSA